MVYKTDTGWLDGCKIGQEYWLEEENEERVLVTKNDLGATSLFFKEKFDLIEPLLEAAEKAVKGE